MKREEVERKVAGEEALRLLKQHVPGRNWQVLEAHLTKVARGDVEVSDQSRNEARESKFAEEVARDRVRQFFAQLVPTSSTAFAS